MRNFGLSQRYGSRLKQSPALYSVTGKLVTQANSGISHKIWNCVRVSLLLQGRKFHSPSCWNNRMMEWISCREILQHYPVQYSIGLLDWEDQQSATHWTNYPTNKQSNSMKHSPSKANRSSAKQEMHSKEPDVSFPHKRDQSNPCRPIPTL
jgi:hypothetical protein